VNSTGPAEGKTPDDSLELLAEQDRVLLKIFDGWDAATPAPDVEDARVLVKQGWERGTFGKLLIEYAAVRVAAKEDVARVLRDVGDTDLAETLTARLRDIRMILDRLDEVARGVDPVGLAASSEFAGAVGELAALIRADLGIEPVRVLPVVAAALGDRRSLLARAKHVESHAPTHPGADRRWYDDIGPLVRIHARYDRLRGFPWAESGPISDADLAERYDNPE
jgi:hypothetical protein